MRLRPFLVLTATTAAVPTLAVVLLAGPAGAAAPTPPIPAGWPAVTAATRTEPMPIAPGAIAYSETYTTAEGPEHAQVLDLQLPKAGGIRLDTVESHDRVADPADETTTSMGDRTGAVAGINGDYFAIHAAGSPLGGTMRGGNLLKSPRPHYQAQLAVERDGSVHIGEVDFSGAVREGHDTEPLTSVNTVADVARGGVTEVTPDLGESPVTAGATFVIGRAEADGFTVLQVRTGLTRVPALAPHQLALLGGAAGGTWLAAHLQVGEHVRVAARLSDPKAAALISGATVLVRGGAVYTDPTGTPPSGRNPETMIGVSRDGRHVLLVVIDGRQTSSIGVTPAEAAGYLVAHGADSGILLDGGGSSTIAARLRHTASLSILNSPSDPAGERPVANGLFLYRR